MPGASRSSVYHALVQPGDVIMSAAQPVGGHSSNRIDGPPGLRGLKVVDIPFDPIEPEVDLDLFAKVARLVRPQLVTLGFSMTLFPYPVRAEPDRIIAALVPELVEAKWYNYFLHNQRARILAARLLAQGNRRIVILNVPWSTTD